MTIGFKVDPDVGLFGCPVQMFHPGWGEDNLGIQIILQIQSRSSIGISSLNYSYIGIF